MFTSMLDSIRRLHWTLLHRVFGLPERSHGGPHAPLSTVLRSHPVVPAHHRRSTGHRQHRLSSQLTREMQRAPRVLPHWQRSIAALFARLFVREEERRA